MPEFAVLQANVEYIYLIIYIIYDHIYYSYIYDNHIYYLIKYIYKYSQYMPINKIKYISIHFSISIILVLKKGENNISF